MENTKILVFSINTVGKDFCFGPKAVNEFPQIVVFDNKGIVLQTGKVEELEEFFLN